MKRFFWVPVGLVICAALFAGARPATWTWVSDTWSHYGQWTDEARRADPSGFARYATAKLRQDLEKLQQTRRELASEAGKLSSKLRSQEATRDQAREVAEEFRAKYQQAVANNSFPIEVRRASYSQAQAKTQVSMILAEINGHEAATERLNKVRRQADTRLEQLTVRINACETQMAALAIQEGMLLAEQLTESGEQLLAQVDQLLDQNLQVLSENPVRSIHELLEVGEDDKPHANDDAVEAFLAAAPKPVRVAKPAVAETTALPAAKPERAASRPAEIEVEEVTVVMPKENDDLVVEQTGRPQKQVFQQF